MLRYIPAYTYTSSHFLCNMSVHRWEGAVLQAWGGGGGGLSPLPFYMNAYNLKAIIFLINWGKLYFTVFEWTICIID
jgi:hypothetical protein